MTSCHLDDCVLSEEAAGATRPASGLGAPGVGWITQHWSHCGRGCCWSLGGQGTLSARAGDGAAMEEHPSWHVLRCGEHFKGLCRDGNLCRCSGTPLPLHSC